MPCSDLDDASLAHVVHNHPNDFCRSPSSALFNTQLESFARLAGVSNLSAFVNILRADHPRHLHRAALEAINVTETSFFRDRNVFESLQHCVLPRLIRARAGTRRLRIWSAATSTGQEAFSVAMLLRGFLPELQHWNTKIVATDISRDAIEAAGRGRFRASEIGRGLSPQMLLEHFAREGEEWIISPSIASVCDFRCANLCEPFTGLPRFDLILLRNVLLYLPEQDRSRVLTAVHRQLHPDGFLVLGSSEQAEDFTALFRPEPSAESSIYRPI